MANQTFSADNLRYSPYFRMVIAGVLLAVLGVGIYIFAKPPTFLEEMDGVVSYKVRILQDSEKVDAWINQAIDQVGKDDWEGARATYSLAAGTAAQWRYAGTAKNQRTKNGMGFGEFVKNRERDLARAMIAQLDKSMPKMLTGEITYKTLSDDVNLFPEPTFDTVRQYFATGAKQVSASRASQAEQWLRVEFHSMIDSSYDADLEAALRSKWSGVGDYQLIVGNSTGIAESASTWKTLSVTVTIDSVPVPVPYDVSLAGELDDFVVGVPERLYVTFNMRSQTTMPSSWDELPPIEIHTPPLPTRRRPEESPRAALTRIRALAAENARFLRNELEVRLKALPEFQLFPDVDASRPLVTADQSFDTDVAYALAVALPARFEYELDQQIVEQHPGLLADAACFLIRRNLNQFVPWLLKQGPRLSERDCFRIIVELERNPTFGNMSCLLMILSHGEFDTATRTLNVLARQQYGDDIAKQVRQILQANEATRRVDLVLTYLRSLQPDSLGRETIWLEDENPDLALRAAQTIRSRAPTVADQVLVERFGHLAPDVRLTLLTDFQYDPALHGEAGIGMLQQVSDDPAGSDALRKAARLALDRAAVYPGVWAACAARIDAQAPLATTVDQRRRLLVTVARARPTEAASWLTTQATDFQARLGDTPANAANPAVELRRLAIIGLCSLPEMAPGTYADLLALVRQYPHDTSLQNTILAGLATSTRDPSFNWAAPGVIDLLSNLSGQPSPGVRQLTYELLVFGLNRATGRVPCRTSLEAALTTERDPELQRYLQRRLAQ